MCRVFLCMGEFINALIIYMLESQQENLHIELKLRFKINVILNKNSAHGSSDQKNIFHSRVPSNPK